MTVPTPLFAPEQPRPAEEEIGPSLVEMARAVAAIAATRMLLLIAVLTGSGIWIWTIADPTRDRLFAAISYSIVFVVPQVALFWRRG